EIAMIISETRTALFCCCRAFLFVFFFLSPPVWPQANQGTIEGIIVDQSGAALPGAKLTGTNDATGIHFQTTSDSNGLFTFPVLPVGTYTIEVEHPGFAKLTQKNIALSVGARLNLSLSLSVAGQTQSVTVTDEPPIVETTRSQVSSTVNDVAIENLPTNGRNFINFVLLTPGVTLDVRRRDISFEGAALPSKADVSAAGIQRDPRSQQNEISEVASVCRQIFNGRVVDRGTNLAPCGLKDGSFARDRHGRHLSGQGKS